MSYRREAAAADVKEEGSFFHNLVALVFASHVVEAYLNYVGERLAPDIWKDERNYFRKEPYRGWEGKLRKVFELAGLPWNAADRPDEDGGWS
jgi:hypothetical protein